MIQFADYVHVIHDDRRRAFVAAAERAARKPKRDGRRRFSPRRALARRRSPSVRGAPT